MATRQAHQDAEDQLSSTNIANDLKAYSRFLKIMYEVHANWGKPSAALLGKTAEFASETRKLKALKQDLRAIRCEQMPDFSPSLRLDENRSFAWGVCYAVAGSSLGSTMLSKSLSPAFNDSKSYLTCCSHYCRNELKSFFQSLDEAKPNLASATSGSIAVFDFVRSSLFDAQQPNGLDELSCR